MVSLLPVITSIITYCYLCYYVIIAYYYGSIITYYYCKNGSLLLIISRSIIGSDGLITTYY